METVSLASSIQYIKGVGPKLAKLFEKKGISTLEDALYFLPRTYEDRSQTTAIADAPINTPVVLRGKILSARLLRRGRRASFEAVVGDSSGKVNLYWFHAYPSLKDEFSIGGEFVVYGEIKLNGAQLQMVHPDYEKIDPDKPLRSQSFHFGRVVPIYSETEGLHQKTIRRIMGEAVKVSLSQLDDPLPVHLRERLALPSLRESFVSLHFPKTIPPEGALSDAYRRVIFEEFFVLQLGLGLKKQQHQKRQAPVMAGGNEAVAAVIKQLPFSLTQDQQKALRAIVSDLSRAEAMTRLVQGDVGSGKTVVALAACAVAASSGWQSALMAPTELLAMQHFRTAEKILAPLGIEVTLLVSANSARAEVKRPIASGAAQVVVGTHALFQGAVEFKNLGLVVVDEQHRFGVEQRTELLRKAGLSHAHLLMMTATPIPRTLAFTLYGDLDLTVIREKPANRQRIETFLLKEKDRPMLYQTIRETVGRGEQVYFIYPLVEQSEKLDLKSATEMYDRLSREVFPTFRVALLHGRMKPDEKEKVLTEFKQGTFQILVSTTVIEVGIDVANATLMVIEHPERLGLSQLHQLRGRVGRGAKASRCLLMTQGRPSPRLRVMEQTEDGFVIAEEDLKIRGPGEFLGTRQSGLPGFRVGHILRDAELLELARAEAERVLSEDPQLKSAENSAIRRMVESRWKEKIERLRG